MKRTVIGVNSPQAGDRALMPEMPHTCEYHGEARSVGGGDHVAVTHRAARLDHRGRPGLGNRLEAVGEGKERVRRGDRALRQAGC